MRRFDSMAGKLPVLALSLILGILSIAKALPVDAAVHQITDASSELYKTAITQSIIVKPFGSAILYGMPSNPDSTRVALVSCSATYIGMVHVENDLHNTFIDTIHFQLSNRTNILFDDVDVASWLADWSSLDNGDATSQTYIFHVKALSPMSFVSTASRMSSSRIFEKRIAVKALVVLNRLVV